MSEKVRAHTVITGMVQGVFFRAETMRAAIKHGVRGWVRNKRDGSVEAVFEGERQQVDAILSWCQTGSPRAVVKNVEVTWQEYSGEYKGFDITY